MLRTPTGRVATVRHQGELEGDKITSKKICSDFFFKNYKKKQTLRWTSFCNAS